MIEKIKKSPQTWEFLVLTAIFSISLLIRWIGVKHGFPLLTHPDEAVIMQPIYQMTAQQTLNPGNFNRPNQILYLLNFIFLNITSYVRFGKNMAVVYPGNELYFYHYARLLIAGMGALIPVIAYKIGKLIKPGYALMFGLVFMFFPSYIYHSLFITPDVPITLFTLIVIYFVLRYLRKGDNRFLYFAILFSAINTAEKYPGLISLAVVFLGILLKIYNDPSITPKEKLLIIIKKYAITSGLFITFLFIVAPNLFFHYTQVFNALINESRSSHLGADYLSLPGRLSFYIQSFMSWTSPLALPFFGVGVYVLIKQRDRYLLVLLYGLLYWISLSLLSLHWERWALPMYLTPLFLIALGIGYLWHTKNLTTEVKLVINSLIILFFALQATTSLHTAVRMTFKDTRVISLDYCQQNGITHENSLYEGYTPLQPQYSKWLFEDYTSKLPDTDYIILSSFMFGRFYAEPGVYPEQIEIYENIRNQHSLIARFEPDPLADGVLAQLDDILFYISRSLRMPLEDRYKGPVIEVYRVTN